MLTREADEMQSSHSYSVFSCDVSVGCSGLKSTIIRSSHAFIWPMPVTVLQAQFYTISVQNCCNAMQCEGERDRGLQV